MLHRLKFFGLITHKNVWLPLPLDPLGQLIRIVPSVIDEMKPLLTRQGLVNWSCNQETFYAG